MQETEEALSHLDTMDPPQHFLDQKNQISEPKAYTIKSRVFSEDPTIGQRLFEQKFTQSQADLLCFLADEYVNLAVEKYQHQLDINHDIHRLVMHFGGEQAWQEAAQSLEKWGKQSLPEPLFEMLASSYDGVLALSKLMESNEPKLAQGKLPYTLSYSESVLKDMMNDPRYWKEKDPDFVHQVQQGFEQLYPKTR